MRSLYVIKDSTGKDFIEFGWKWLVDGNLASSSADTPDVKPTPFAARVVNGTYTLSEGLGSGDPGWALINPDGSPHSFRIELNVDGNHPNTFYFFRDGLATGSFFHANMTSGFTLSGSEAQADCDTLLTHDSSLRRKLSGVWGSWAGNVKSTAFIDKSKWWYYDKITNSEYRLSHCVGANCVDVN